MEYLYLLITIFTIASSQIPPGPPIITGPQMVLVNQYTVYTCTSTRGSPTPTVKWFTDDTEITTGVVSQVSGTHVATTISFIASLSYHLVELECRVENGVLQNPLNNTKFVEVHFTPQEPILNGPTTMSPGHAGTWTCISANGYRASTMTMRNRNKNTMFASEFSSTTEYVLHTKSYDVTGTLNWSPVMVNNGDTICCDVIHEDTLTAPQTVCRQITVARKPPVTNIPQPSYSQTTGHQIVLGCSVSSPDSGLLEVQWTFTNNAGHTIDPILVSTSNGKYFGSKTSNPSLTIKNVASMDQGTYSCKARNEIGTSTKNPNTTLIVTENKEEENIITYVVLGCFAVLTLIVILIVLMCYRRGFKLGRKKKKDNVSNQDGLDPTQMHVFHTAQVNGCYSMIPDSHFEQDNTDLELDQTNLEQNNAHMEPVRTKLEEPHIYFEPVSDNS